jgi:Big-like domain-containing protein
MRKVLALTCLALLACCAEASARCSVPRIHTFNNQAVDGHMTVNSGARCSIKLKHSAGPTYGAHIVQRASNGTVTVDGRNRIVYRSRAGYVGSDSFTYARTGESRGGDAVTRTVRVDVTVTP